MKETKRLLSAIALTVHNLVWDGFYVTRQKNGTMQMEV